MDKVKLRRACAYVALSKGTHESSSAIVVGKCRLQPERYNLRESEVEE